MNRIELLLTSAGRPSTCSQLFKEQENLREGINNARALGYDVGKMPKFAGTQKHLESQLSNIFRYKKGNNTICRKKNKKGIWVYSLKTWALEKKLEKAYAKSMELWDMRKL